jgi:hypothetical protein
VFPRDLTISLCMLVLLRQQHAAVSPGFGVFESVYVFSSFSITEILLGGFNPVDALSAASLPRLHPLGIIEEK